MRSKRLEVFGPILSILIFVFTLLQGQEAVAERLSYRLQPGDELVCSIQQESSQTLLLDTGEQVQVGSTNSEYSIRVRREGRDLKLRVRPLLADFELRLPQGNLNPNLDAILGRVFTLHMDKYGRESNLRGHSRLEFDLAPGTQRSLVTSFQGIFPDLPRVSLSIGDSWFQREQLDDSDSRNQVEIIMEIRHELLGFQEIEGRHMARIASQYSGHLIGHGPAEENMIYRAVLEGEGNWLFDLEAGMLYRQELWGRGEGSIIGVGEIPFQVPFTRDLHQIIEVEKRSYTGQQ